MPYPQADGRAQSAASGQQIHSMYIVQCSDGSWYTGYTRDVAKRLATHNAGKGARYTRTRLPVSLVAQADFAGQHDAMRAEALVKRLSRAQKEALVNRSRALAVPLADILYEQLLGPGPTGQLDNPGPTGQPDNPGPTGQLDS